MRTSDTIGEIAKALAEFQANVGNVPKTAVNPHFHSNFAPLDEIVSAINQCGPSHGLSHVQSVGSDEQCRATVTSRVMHNPSGEWIESDTLTMPAEKATAQGSGSAITYGRRYQLPALYGLATEDDDDGNHAAGSAASKPAFTPAPVQADGPSAYLLTFGQHNGTTLEDLDKTDEGRSYILWLAQQDAKKPATQAARAYLEALGIN